MRLITGPTLARLEYGEADIAFRAGKMPSDPDYVVVPFSEFTIGLFAAADYVKRRGCTKDSGRILGSRLHCAYRRARPSLDLYSLVTETRSPGTSFRYECNEWPEVKRAIEMGLGIGFIPHKLIEGRTDLVEIMPPRKRWSISTWRVTHVDVHRSPKVQGFLSALNETN